jgi:hypothetical protein
MEQKSSSESDSGWTAKEINLLCVYRRIVSVHMM